MAAVLAALVVLFTPPVAGPVVRGFQPPSTAYGPGHVGLDYAVTPGEPVAAVGAGTVVFAGPVGATLHVTIRLTDGRLTTLSFLRSIAVSAGATVQRGDVVGTAGGVDPLDATYDGTRLLLTLRVGGRYVDPSVMFAPVDLGAVVHLVPWSSPAPSEAGAAPASPQGVAPAVELLALTSDLSE